MERQILQLLFALGLAALFFFGLSGQVMAADFDQTDNFSSGFGNWNNVAGDNWDWTRSTTGTTPSSSTGPQGSDQGGDNAFVFTETSSGGANDTFYLESNNLDADTYALSVSFYYHMYGSTIGSLHLDVWNGSSWDLSVWSLSGDQGNSWIQHTVDLSAAGYDTGTIKLRFRGISGGLYYGDISLDTIRVFGDVSTGPGLVYYSFPFEMASPAGLIAPTSNDPAVTGSFVTNGSTDIYEVANAGYETSPELRLGPQATDLGGAVAADSYIQFSMGANTGTEVDLAELTFKAARGSAGTACGWGLRSSVDGYSTDIASGTITSDRPTWSDYTVDLSAAPFQDLTGTITFRLYVYGPSPAATVELDEIIIDGNLAASAGGGDGVTILDSAGFDGGADYGFWTATNNSTNGWTLDSNETPSRNVGPSGPKAGSSYIYTEASSPSGLNEWYLTSGDINAATWDANLSFWYNKYHNTTTTCNLKVQASTNGGSSWTDLWSTNRNQGIGGSSGTTWLNESIDLSTYDGIINVRFFASSGGNWTCDTALDSVVVKAVPACVSTTGPPVISSIKTNGNPISVCDAIDLKGSNLVNVKIDNGTLYDGASCSDINTSIWPYDLAYNNYNLRITAQDNCGFQQVVDGTFEYSSCEENTGPISVQEDGLLSGSVTDVSKVISTNGATIDSVTVWEVTGTGGDIDVLEKFDRGGLEGWGPSWVATKNDGITLQDSPSGNGDLMTGFFTRTEGTGPSAPYDGDFIYYEASTGDLTDRYLVNRTAEGTDITYDAGNHALTLTFKYLMNGADIGNLELQAKNPNYNGGAWTTEWHASGSQGDVWKSATVNLQGDGVTGGGESGVAYIAGETQFRFRFTWGGGPLGDIALDNIRVLGPRSVNPVPLIQDLDFANTGDGVDATNADTTGWPDGGALRVEVTGTNNCGSALSDWGFVNFKSDGTAPSLVSFALPDTALSPVEVFDLAAIDYPNPGGSGVDGYLIKVNDATPPSPTATACDPDNPAEDYLGCWSTEPPLRVSTGLAGELTFYAWAKDAARNISDSLSQTVTVSADEAAPTVNTFVMPTIGFLPLTVSSFSATDDSGVVRGYMITESPTPPAAGAAGWLSAPPTVHATSASGSTTFYAWAKDSVGNVSEALSQVVDVKVDNNPPVVTFDLPDTHASYVIPVTTLLAGDTTGGTANNTGVAAYMITTSSDQPNADDPRWVGVAPSAVSTSSEGAHQFWAWAKDNSGNVSSATSDTVTVDLPDACDFEVDMAGTLVQTENYTSMGAPDPWAWDTIMTPLADSSVQSALNNGSGDLSSGGYIITATGGTGSTPQGSRADYPLFFTTPGNYCMWIRGLDEAGRGGGDSNFWGVDGRYVGAMTQSADNQWAWTNGLQNGARCTDIGVNNLDTWDPDGTGPMPAVTGQWHTINLWPREDGQKNDMFLLTTNSNSTAGGLFSGNNDLVTVIPAGVKELDPTCVSSVGGGAPGTGGGDGDYITIHDDQMVIGTPIDVETLYESNLSGALEYRALGPQTDGYEHFVVDDKWNYTNVGGDALDPDAVDRVEGQGVFKLTGSGADIWGSTDYFSFNYQPGVSGDFVIDVNVRALVDRATGTGSNQNSSAKAGIMVRQSLSANSRNVMMAVTDGVGARLQRRTTDGGTTAYVNGTNGVTPSADTWLRLKRSGSTFEGFYSTDNGATWVSVGTTDVTMTGSILVGLGVTSHDTSRDSIATFDNFLFMPAGLSGMSESWTSTTTPLETDLPTAWSEQDYAIAIRDPNVGSGSAYQANTFAYNPCIDTTPSSLAIHNASVVGAAVSLNSLFDYSGNPTNFNYEINGNTVLNPWNSYSVVPNGTTADVILKVTATDPDCGSTTVSAIGSITVDNTCNDTTPSTITILTGQVVGGPHVDLTELFTATGNVDTVGFTYKVNGVVIGDPASWDSRAFGNQTPETVTLEVESVDPDCGNTISGLNEITIDNTCIRNPPSLSFNVDEGHVGKGRTLPYQVTIRNEDSFNCGPSTFDITVLSESNNSDFDAAFFNPTDSNLDILLGGRESATIELAVPARSSATDWNSNDTTLQVTSSYGAIHNNADWRIPHDGNPDGPVTGTVTTTVFLVSPITHNSVTTGSTRWSGKWGTSEPGAKYGNFDCLVCHEKGGPNIKWMLGEIRLPGATWGTGSSAEHLPIVFKDTTEGPALPTLSSEDNDWGNDDPAGTDVGEPIPNGGPGRISSERTCEVCHTQTMYHRYNTAGQESLEHFNGRDCTDCHRHSQGFTAGCTGCHGDPPLESAHGGPNGLADIPGVTGSVTPGTHYKHVEVLQYPCEYCHAGWRNIGEMPKEVGGLYQINHKFNVFFDQGMTDPTKDNGHYTGQDGVNYEPDAEAIAEGRQNPDGTIPSGKGTLTCENIYCHGGTESMGGTNPQWNGNITCNSCHGTSATDTPPGYSHTTHVGKRGMACTLCHAVPDGKEPGYNGHVDGRVRVDMSHLPAKNGTPIYNGNNGSYISATVYESNADGSDMPPSNSYGTCSNVACHFGTETPVWNGGVPATCTTCHNSGADDADLVHSAPLSGNHEQHVDPDTGNGGVHVRMINTFVNKCESCHGGGSNEGEHPGHIDFATTIGGGMTYDGSTCTSVCHDARHIVWGSPDPLSCEACHMAPYLGPTIVDPDGEGTGLPTGSYGSHIRSTNNEVLNANTDWTTQCRMCHPYHTTNEPGETIFKIPVPGADWDQLGDGTDMAYRLGLQFPVSQGIHLGGTAISDTATTEAEMCWDCHDDPANNISEWGVNNNTMTGSLSYDYGSVSTSNWTSAIWTSGEASFSYKTAPIQSTHAATVSSVASQVSRSGVDDVGALRCTYCHDVHDLNKAVIDINSGQTEAMIGQPYLRGTWLGNPYKEDGAPQAGTTYTNFPSDRFGEVPRGSNEPAQKMGGYWIDQNSGDPTGADANAGVALTYKDFGGICQLCHGEDINSLNQYGSQGAGWISGYNGHANSVRGGAGGGGITARNIFNNTDRGGSQSSRNGYMAYWGRSEPGENNAGLRYDDESASRITPYVDGRYSNTGGTENGSYSVRWDDLRSLDMTGGSTSSPDNNYHTFSCSKCHNPHASRLPKLMITNCLDTKHNQWDNTVQYTNSSPSILNNKTASNWTTAQNCHRLAGNDPIDINDTAGQGAGWNKVTPWDDADGDYSTTGDKSQDYTGSW